MKRRVKLWNRERERETEKERQKVRKCMAGGRDNSFPRTAKSRRRTHLVHEMIPSSTAFLHLFFRLLSSLFLSSSLFSSPLLPLFFPLSLRSFLFPEKGETERMASPLEVAGMKYRPVFATTLHEAHPPSSRGTFPFHDLPFRVFRVSFQETSPPVLSLGSCQLVPCLLFAENHLFCLLSLYAC